MGRNVSVGVCSHDGRHLDGISDFLFWRVFCDGWVMNANFS